MISRRGSACMPGVTDADATRTGEARRRRSFGHLSRLSQRANERDTTPGERPDTGVTRSTFRFSLRVFVHLSVGGENENLFITPSVRSRSFVRSWRRHSSDAANDSLDAVAVGQGEGGGLSVVARGVGIAPCPLNDVILARR